MAGVAEKLAAKRAAKAKEAEAAPVEQEAAAEAPDEKVESAYARRKREKAEKAAAEAAPAPKGKAKKVAKAPEPEKVEEAPAGSSNKERARGMFEAGKSRREIADELGISYGTVFHHTKDMEAQEASRARVFVEVGEGKNKKQVSRTEAMRQDFTDGMSVGDIARKYDVIYQVAYQATKAQRDAQAEAEAKAAEAPKAKKAKA